MSITQSQLKSQLHYCPTTGIFTWLVSGSGRDNSLVAGTKNKYGYISIIIKGKKHLSHRLAWLYMYGEFPKEHIDHINGVKDDNRICNLRNANDSTNQKNRKKNKNNTSGNTGIRVENKKYRVRIKVSGKLLSLGSYTSLDEAISVRKEAEVKHGFTERHGK